MAIRVVEFSAMFKKQGTSGLPEVTDNIDGTQNCMCSKATHAAEIVKVGVCLNFSDFRCLGNCLQLLGFWELFPFFRQKSL